MHHLTKAKSVNFTTEDAQLQILTVKCEALEAEYNTIHLEKKEYEKEIEELKQKIDSLQQENKTYIELMNLEQQKKPALNVQISSMTTSLQCMNSEKAELERKVTEYGQLIKLLTTENYEIKESNEKYKITLEKYDKQKQAIKQIQDEMNENNFNRIIELETENQTLTEQLDLIKNNVLMNEADEKVYDDHIKTMKINDTNSNISKPGLWYIKSGGTPSKTATPITPNKPGTLNINRLYSNRYNPSQTALNMHELTVGIPTPLSPSFRHPQFIAIDTSQNIINQYPQLNGGISSQYSESSNLSQPTPNTDHIESMYPYIDEQEDDHEVILDANDKKLSEMMVGYKQKIEDLESELTDCYTEIAQLKGNIQRLKDEDNVSFINKNKKIEDETDSAANNRLYILLGAFFKG